MRPIILASQSPRRLELLRSLGFEPLVCPSDAPEESPYTDPAPLVKDLSQLKARDIAKKQKEAIANDAILIAADTIVSLDNQILEKPTNSAENIQFLERLSGQTHQVWTGVTIISKEGEFSILEKAEVTFRTLSQEEIKEYIETQEGLDKAGGYGIQGKGMSLVAQLDGDFYTVMGLPLAVIAQELGRLGAF